MIFRASRNREKQRDAYLRIGQPQGSLRLPDIERIQGDGYLCIGQT